MEIANNKRALHEFTVSDSLEAGIMLTGAEVKAAREGKVSLKGSFVKILQGEAFLVNAHIGKYSKSATQAHEDRRTRKLLLKRKELFRLIGLASAEGLTVLPLSLYTKGPRLKLGIGVVRKKKRHDKREIAKERDARRSIERTMKAR